MQIKIFTLPLGCENSQLDELNHFLRANKVVDVRKEFFCDGGNSGWSFCVTFLLDAKTEENFYRQHDKKNKVDYKEMMSPDVFDRFANMRKIRKILADNEAVPAFAIFSDAELAEIAKLPELTLSAVKQIPGIGEKRADKYAHVLIDKFLSSDETGRQSDAGDIFA